MDRILFFLIFMIAALSPNISKSDEMTSTNYQLVSEPIGVSGSWVASAQFYLYSTIGMPPVVSESTISTPAGYSLQNGVDTSLVYLALYTSVLPLNIGWNLIGNSSTGSLDVVSTLGNANKIITVWKWIPATSKWAFYAPSMTAPNLATYAAGKGYDVLTAVNGGEGFWVNAKVAFTAQLPAGTAVATTSFRDQPDPTLNKLPKGWSLIAVGDNPSPRNFVNMLAVSPPLPPDVAATSLTTLWTWDNGLSSWYFYAPSLDNSGGLANYITSKGYLDFTAKGKTLDPTTGFWVNHP